MCNLVSGFDQRPFAVQSPKCAPQPSFNASVNSCRAWQRGCRGWPCSTLFSHHFIWTQSQPGTGLVWRHPDMTCFFCGCQETYMGHEFSHWSSLIVQQGLYLSGQVLPSYLSGFCLQLRLASTCLVLEPETTCCRMSVRTEPRPLPLLVLLSSNCSWGDWHIRWLSEVTLSQGVSSWRAGCTLPVRWKPSLDLNPGSVIPAENFAADLLQRGFSVKVWTFETWWTEEHWFTKKKPKPLTCFISFCLSNPWQHPQFLSEPCP